MDPSALDPSALDPSALDPSALDPSALDPSAWDPSKSKKCCTKNCHFLANARSGQILGFDWLSKTLQSFTNVVLRVAIFWPMQGRARFWVSHQPVHHSQRDSLRAAQYIKGKRVQRARSRMLRIRMHPSLLLLVMTLCILGNSPLSGRCKVGPDSGF